MLHPIMGGGTWKIALADYRRWCFSSGSADSTVALRLQYLDRLAAEHPDPFKVTPDELLTFLSHPSWAPETRKSARAAVRSFYRWAHDSERVDVDPSVKLPTVRVPAGKPKPAPENTIVAALSRANPSERLMVMLAAFAGLRCCEIARAHTDDLVDGSLRVNGKGGRVRIVPLHTAILARIDPTSGWLFPSPYGGHLQPSSVSVILRRVLGPGYSAHTLRHRFATQAYAATHDLRAIQELLGHSKPETTARYTLVPDDALRAAVWGAFHVA